MEREQELFLLFNEFYYSSIAFLLQGSVFTKNSKTLYSFHTNSTKVRCGKDASSALRGQRQGAALHPQFFREKIE